MEFITWHRIKLLLCVRVCVCLCVCEKRFVLDIIACLLCLKDNFIILIASLLILNAAFFQFYKPFSVSKSWMVERDHWFGNRGDGIHYLLSICDV